MGDLLEHGSEVCKTASSSAGALFRFLCKCSEPEMEKELNVCSHNKKRKRIVFYYENSSSVSTSTLKISLIVLQWSF